MDYRRQFLIPFGGLKLGNHRFEFEINDRFFEEFEYSDYKKGSLIVHVDMEKQQRMLVFTFTLSGSIEVMCDRCLDLFETEIAGNFHLFVKFGSDSHEESDDVIVIPESESRFDVSHYIYEYITLSVPIRHVHPENENGESSCDPSIIQRLQTLSSTTIEDPRWEILKKLKK